MHNTNTYKIPSFIHLKLLSIHYDTDTVSAKKALKV